MGLLRFIATVRAGGCIRRVSLAGTCIWTAASHWRRGARSCRRWARTRTWRAAARSSVVIGIFRTNHSLDRHRQLHLLVVQHGLVECDSQLRFFLIFVGSLRLGHMPDDFRVFGHEDLPGLSLQVLGDLRYNLV